MIRNILFALLLIQCSAYAAFASPVPVLVSIPPQKWLVERIGGPLVRVHVLLDRGQEPHGFEPTPEQVRDLFRSRVYFTVGLEFERNLTGRIRRSDTGTRIADTSAGIKKIPMREHGHDAEHEHVHGSGLDPHVWLDPQNLKQMASVMAETLAAADPANAGIYTANLRTVQATLTALHRELQQILAPSQGQTLLVFHPAFGYFARAYGLRQEAVEVEGKSPAPKQLFALVKRAKAEGIRAIFVQPQFDRRNARTVAEAILGQVVVLDPLAEDVPANLRSMAEKIRTALAP